MLPDLDTLWTLVDRLDAEAECVTFYDALALVRAARPFADLPQGLLVDWVALHDAPHVTDGARLVLGQFLQQLTSRQQQNRRLGTQLIVLKDSGKTLRVPIGQGIAMALDARPELGWAWQYIDGPDALRVDVMPTGTSPGQQGVSARFVLTPKWAAHGLCRFEEVRGDARPRPGVMPSKRQGRPAKVDAGARRTFEIFVIIEAASSR